MGVLDATPTPQNAPALPPTSTSKSSGVPPSPGDYISSQFSLVTPPHDHIPTTRGDTTATAKRLCLDPKVSAGQARERESNHPGSNPAFVFVDAALSFGRGLQTATFVGPPTGHAMTTSVIGIRLQSPHVNASASMAYRLLWHNGPTESLDP